MLGGGVGESASRQLTSECIWKDEDRLLPYVLPDSHNSHSLFLLFFWLLLLCMRAQRVDKEKHKVKA
jgi:hypothetical protein